jgi:hypothetical protein
MPFPSPRGPSPRALALPRAAVRTLDVQLDRAQRADVELELVVAGQNPGKVTACPRRARRGSGARSRGAPWCGPDGDAAEAHRFHGTTPSTSVKPMIDRPWFHLQTRPRRYLDAGGLSAGRCQSTAQARTSQRRGSDPWSAGRRPGSRAGRSPGTVAATWPTVIVALRAGEAEWDSGVAVEPARSARSVR